MQTVILILIWLALVLLSALRFRVSGLTRFELNRRLASNDTHAKGIIERDSTLPLLEALRLLIASILAALVVGVSIGRFRFIIGIIVALLLLYLAESLSALRWVRRATAHLLGGFEPQY